MTAFGNALRAKRRSLDLTQTQAARLLGVTQQTFANWELGSAVRHGMPGYASTISLLARFLGCDVPNLLEMMYVEDEDLPEKELLTVYEERITQLEAIVKTLRAKAAEAAP